MIGPPLSHREVAEHLEREIASLEGLGICRDQAMLAVAERVGRHQADIRWMLDRFGSHTTARGCA